VYPSFLPPPYPRIFPFSLPPPIRLASVASFQRCSGNNVVTIPPEAPTCLFFSDFPQCAYSRRNMPPLEINPTRPFIEPLNPFSSPMVPLPGHLSLSLSGKVLEIHPSFLRLFEKRAGNFDDLFFRLLAGEIDFPLPRQVPFTPSRSATFFLPAIPCQNFLLSPMKGPPFSPAQRRPSIESPPDQGSGAC